MNPRPKSTSLPTLPGPAWQRRLHAAIVPWYARHARHLPWRLTRDPYAIWVSETMLQQTQVETVKTYYARFLERFPTIEALAAASEEEVLRLWEGLGYYRRARQLQQAAQHMVALHDGHFPADVDQVRALPGVGRYTAGAVLSIAWDQRQPILEANTIRLFSRLLGFRGDVRRADGQRLLWNFASAILPTDHVGTFNQALMELGSLVCVPQRPACPACPLAALCPTRRHGWQAEIPQAKPAVVYERIQEAAVVLWRQDRLLLRRCAPGERWAGLWDVPRFTPRQFPPSADEIKSHMRDQWQLEIGLRREQTELKYGVTRFRIHLAAFGATWRRGQLPSTTAAWVAPDELSDYPLNVTGRKLVDWALADRR